MKSISVFIFMFVLFFGFFMNSCTLSVNVAQSGGKGTDLLDEQDSVSPHVQAEANVQGLKP